MPLFEKGSGIATPGPTIQIRNLDILLKFYDTVGDRKHGICGEYLSAGQRLSCFRSLFYQDSIRTKNGYRDF